MERERSQEVVECMSCCGTCTFLLVLLRLGEGVSGGLQTGCVCEVVVIVYLTVVFPVVYTPAHVLAQKSFKIMMYRLHYNGRYLVIIKLYEAKYCTTLRKHVALMETVSFGYHDVSFSSDRGP